MFFVRLFNTCIVLAIWYFVAGPLSKTIGVSVNDALWTDRTAVDESAAFIGGLAGSGVYALLVVGGLWFLKNTWFPKKSENDATSDNTKEENDTSINSPPVLTKTSEEQIKVKSQQKEIKPNLVKSEDEVLDTFPDAKIVIEYDENASKLWNELKGLDKKIGFEFIECLQKDPKQNIDKLYADLKGKFAKQKFQQEHPYADPNANKAFQEALQISEAARDEFSKVYELMKDKLEPDQILEKVKGKFNKSDEKKFIEPKVQLFEGWEEELQKAERSGKTEKILTCLSKLGYKTDAENKKIIRPKLGDSTELQQEQITFETAHDLMRVVGDERRLLLKVK